MVPKSMSYVKRSNLAKRQHNLYPLEYHSTAERLTDTNEDKDIKYQEI
jgi:hypothetical protein